LHLIGESDLIVKSCWLLVNIALKIKYKVY
jgi:hypothetical protein